MKNVREVEFKFFNNYSEALSNSNYWFETIDIEGDIPPDKITSKVMKEDFEIRVFSRDSRVDRFLEKVYVKVS